MYERAWNGIVTYSLSNNMEFKVFIFILLQVLLETSSRPKQFFSPINEFLQSIQNEEGVNLQFKPRGSDEPAETRSSEEDSGSDASLLLFGMICRVECGTEDCIQECTECVDGVCTFLRESLSFESQVVDSTTGTPTLTTHEASKEESTDESTSVSETTTVKASTTKAEDISPKQIVSLFKSSRTTSTTTTVISDDLVELPSSTSTLFSPSSKFVEETSDATSTKTSSPEATSFESYSSQASSTGSFSAEASSTESSTTEEASTTESFTEEATSTEFPTEEADSLTLEAASTISSSELSSTESTTEEVSYTEHSTEEATIAESSTEEATSPQSTTTSSSAPLLRWPKRFQ